MADSTSTPEGFSLKRWSRRKLEASRAEAPEGAPTTPAPISSAVAAAAPAGAIAPATPDADAAEAIDGAPSLPPIESLTTDSDFSAFMQPKVDEALQRAALKKLFTDPHFNVMDGLDIYTGDYTQADPMPDGMLEKLGKVYGMAKEVVAEGGAAPEEASIVQANAEAPERAPATATDEQPDAAAGADSDASQTSLAPDPGAALPLDDSEPPAIVPSPAATERVR